MSHVTFFATPEYLGEHDGACVSDIDCDFNHKLPTFLFVAMRLTVAVCAYCTMAGDR